MEPSKTMFVQMLFAACLGACSGADALDEASFEETEVSVQPQTSGSSKPADGALCVARCAATTPECVAGTIMVAGTMKDGMCCGHGTTPVSVLCMNCDFYTCTSTIREPPGGIDPPPPTGNHK